MAGCARPPDGTVRPSRAIACRACWQRPSLTERGSAMSASPLRADMVSVGIDVR